MGREIEQRVVQMEFDNRQFERNTATTMSTLDKLKQKLKFDSVRNSFEGITAAAKNVDLNSISSSAEAVNIKFDAMQVFAVTALTRISNAAIDAGSKIIKSLTIDPIKLGFQEYETQINAVQTILANTSTKGTTLTQVNAALDELNTYADKTIYNFTEMTRNIGTFTAAGVDLDTSVSAIKGIANLAAVSGSTSQQASTAMYQLSQALASGTVKLQDWNSVVNAGMGGQIFQDALKETAKLHGKNVDAMIKKSGSFRDTLTENAWLTTEILTETLDKFTGDLNKEQLMAKGYTEAQADEIVKLGNMANDAATKVKTFTQLFDTLQEAAQSGWTQTWEILVGDFEEAKEMLTTISNTVGDIIQKFSDSRNNLLASWKGIGGRNFVVDGIANIWKNVYNIVSKVIEAFREVFPAMDPMALFKLSVAFKQMTDRLMWGEKALESIKMAFKGLFAIVKVVVTVLALPLKFIPVLVGLFDLLATIVAKIAGVFGAAVSTISIFNGVGKVVGNVIDFIVKWMVIGIDTITNFVEWLHIPLTLDSWIATIPLIGKLITMFENMGNKVKESMTKFKLSFSGIDTTNINKIFDNIKKPIIGFIDIITSKFKSLPEHLAKVTGFFKGFKDNITSGFKTKSESSGLNEFVKNISVGVSSGANYLKEQMSKIPGVITTNINGMLEFFARGLEGFKEFSKGIPEAVLTSVDTTLAVFDKIQAYISGKLSGLASTVKSCMSTIGSWVSKGFKWVGDFINAVDWVKVYEFITGAIAAKFFLNLSQFFKRLGGAAENASTLGGITDSITGALDSAKDSFKAWQKDLRAEVLIKIAKAVLMIAGSMLVLSMIDPKKLMASMVAMAGIFTMLTTSAILISKFGDGTIRGLTSMAIAIGVISLSVAKLSSLDPAKAMKGVGIISAIMAALVAYSAGTKLLGGGASGGALQIITMSMAINVLSMAIARFAEIDPIGLVKGLLTVMSLMASIALFSKVVRPKGILQAASSMSIMAYGLTAMVVPLMLLSMIKTETLIDGLLSIAAVLGVVGIAMKLMSGTGALGSAAALSIIAGSLVTFGAALFIIGKLPLEVIKVAMITIGIALAGLVGSLMLLAPLTPALVGLAAVMLSFSTSLVITGLALVAFGFGLTALAAGLTAIGLMLAGFVTGMVTFSTAIFKMIPIMIKVLTELVLALVESFTALAEPLTNALILAVKMGLRALVDCSTDIAEAFIKMLRNGLSMVAKNIEPMIVDLVKILIGIMRGLSTHMPELVFEALNLIMTMFASITDAIKQIDFDMVIDAIIGASFFAVFLGVITALSPLLPGAAVALLGFGGIIMELIAILALIGGLGQIPGLKWLMGEGGKVLSQLGFILGDIFGSILGGIAKGSTDVLPEVGESLSGFMKNAEVFLNGMDRIDDSLLDKVGKLSEMISLLTDTALTNQLWSFLSGETPLAAFGEELLKFAPAYKQYGDIMSTVNGDQLGASADAVKTLAEFVKIVPRKNALADALLGEKNVVAFGEALCKFAPYIARFAHVVSDVDAESITASSNAALTLAQFANNLPNPSVLRPYVDGDGILTMFGQELESFGPHLRKYADSVTGIDVGVVDNSINAANTIAAFAKNLPNGGGLLAAITGDNSIALFGMELASFGPNFKKYADSIVGIDTDVITKSSAAATTLAEFAKIVPNTGGLLALLTGDNSLTGLAKQLTKFGPALAEYSVSVKEVDVNSIIKSIDASEYLIELAKIIPNGKLMLRTFGDDLADFGKSLAKYYKRIENVDNLKLESSVRAINSLVDMAKGIDGLNTYDMQAFSESLAGLSREAVDNFIKEFSDAEFDVSVAIVGLMRAAFDGLDDLSPEFTNAGKRAVEGLENSIKTNVDGVKMATKAMFDNIELLLRNSIARISLFTGTGMDAMASTIMNKRSIVVGSMSSVIDDMINAIGGNSSPLYNAGGILVLNLTNGMANASSKAVTVASGLCNSVISTINGNSSKFTLMGNKIATYLATGFSSETNKLVRETTTMMNVMASTINNQYNRFKSLGSNLVGGIIAGVRSRSSELSSIMYNLTRVSIGNYDWVMTGKYMVEGFARGISDYSYLAERSAMIMANKANLAVRQTLQIHSPSRIAVQLGSYFVRGFANGISDNEGMGERASESLAERTKNALVRAISYVNDLITEDMDCSPVITPVLDLSNVEMQSRMLDTMVSRTAGVNASTIMNANRAIELNGVVGGQNGGSNVQFVQNNYSPKSLSTVDIYRQTRNQISRLKGRILND